MRTIVTIRLNPDVLAAARTKAASDNRTLTNYIETLVRRDIQMGMAEPTLEVIAPADIREFVPVPIPGETEEDLKRRSDIVSAILDASGH